MSELPMKVLAMIWAGQAASLLGSGLTGFALGVHVYQRTGSVKAFALIQFFSLGPVAVLSPFAGALTDRWDKRRTLILCNAVACLLPLGLAWCLADGAAPLWQIGLGAALISAVTSVQWPAFAGLVRLLVPIEHLSRAAGATELARGLAQVFAPVLAGLALLRWSIDVLLIIDAATYVLSASVLLALPTLSSLDHHARRWLPTTSLLQDVAAGWRYLCGRRELLVLLAFIAFTNVALGIVEICITPLVLSIASPTALGVVLWIGGIGMLIGGVLMSAWRGSARPLRLVLVVTLLQGVLLIVGGKLLGVVTLAAVAFLYLFAFPVSMSTNHAIWLRVIPMSMQGSVLGLRRAIEGAALPVAALLSGPLIESVFEPLASSGGVLAHLLGAVGGPRPGHGIALMYVALGAVTVLAATAALLTAPALGAEPAAPPVGE